MQTKMVRKHRAFIFFQFNHSPFFQLNCCFQSEPAIHYISSHRPHFAPPLLPHRCVSLTKWPCIKTGKKSSCIHHFSVRPFTVFQLYHVCGVNPKFLPSSPTYRILSYRHCHPLAFTKTGQRGKRSGKKISRLDNFAVLLPTYFIKIALFGLIGTHLQLLVGFILYFISPLGLDSFGQMKDAALRLTSLEHPLINIIAIVLITIGWSKHKKAENSTAKFKSIAIFYGIGLLMILSRLPWKLWFAN